MQTLTIPKKEYDHLLRRQAKIEEEMRVVKEVLRNEINGESIRPAILKRWERISSGLDAGKGRVFSSLRDMQSWLRSL
ncbi:MAG: hypothetical protein WAP52_01750 [Candidatus Sungiibacteriota bacterium]